MKAGSLSRSGPCCSTVTYFDPPLEVIYDPEGGEDTEFPHLVRLKQFPKIDGEGTTVEEALEMLSHSLCMASDTDPDDWAGEMREPMAFIKSKIQKMVWTAPEGHVIETVVGNQVTLVLS